MEENNKEAISSTLRNKEKVQHGEEGGGNDAGNNKANIDSPAPELNTMTRVQAPSLSQVDADMAFARALWEQERAYYFLQMGHEADDYDGDEENDTDDHFDGANFDTDEAFAWALQEREDRGSVAPPVARTGGHSDEDVEPDNMSYHEDVDPDNMSYHEDVDPDNMSYEELIALGEAVGTVSKGLNPQSIATLEQFTYVSNSKADEICSIQDQCVVCQCMHEGGDKIVKLPCNHQYHLECIQQWLQCNKVCPVCNAEVVSSTGNTPKP